MSFGTIRTNDISKYIGMSHVLIIDLRDKKEYDTGHIPTAINIPYDDLELNYSKFSSNDLLIFYCDKGNVSLLACRDLMKSGYQVKSLYGGLRAYRGKLERTK